MKKLKIKKRIKKKNKKHIHTGLAMDNDKEVTKEDQEMINKFGLIHSKLKECTAKIDELHKELDTIHDAQGDVMMAPEEPGALKLSVGEAYMDATLDDVMAKLEERETAIQSEIDEMDKKATEYKASLDELKVALYGKFGRAAINLDE